MVSLIQLSWKTSPPLPRGGKEGGKERKRERTLFFKKSALSHSGTSFAFRLKPAATLKSYLKGGRGGNSLFSAAPGHRLLSRQTVLCADNYKPNALASVTIKKRRYFLVYTQVMMCIRVMVIILLARVGEASNQCNGLSNNKQCMGKWSILMHFESGVCIVILCRV